MLQSHKIFGTFVLKRKIDEVSKELTQRDLA
jgi:hypothetical protein